MVQRAAAGSAQQGQVLAAVRARWARRQSHQSSRGESRRDFRFIVEISLATHQIVDRMLYCATIELVVTGMNLFFTATALHGLV